ncbi:MAG TPA: hypothetical protein DCL35_01995 [Candidatus Omnitrophica bacterium]|nr:hypothetical protein [Candidatus Omnitrophota bacterium]
MKDFRAVSLAFLLIAVTFAVFSPCLQNSFVNWDDDIYVTQNVSIRALSWQQAKKIFTSFSSGNYQPLTILSYAIEYRYFKLSPLPYHATNIILHIFNSLLVFWLFCLILKKRDVSFAVALLFAIHPMHVESVAWVSGRKDVLYSLFFLAAIISYCYFKKRPGKTGFYYFSILLFLFSLTAKAMALTLPFALLLLDYFSQRRLNKAAIIEKIPFFVFSVVFGAIAVIALYSGGAARQEPSLNLLKQLEVASHGIVFYLGKLIFPIRLSCMYPYAEMGRGLVFLLVLLASFVSMSIFVPARHRKTATFGAGFFLLTLLPALQFLPAGDIVVADRYTYIPYLGIFFILSVGYFRLCANAAKLPVFIRRLLAIAAFCVVAAYGVSAWSRCHVWRDPVSLWTDAVKKYPNVSTAHFNLGALHLERGDDEKALGYIQRALELSFRWDCYLLLGNIFLKRNDYGQALAFYGKAGALRPEEARVYNNIGLVYYKKGRDYWGRAVDSFDKAIRLDPGSYATFYNLGLVYEEMGDRDGALRNFDKAFELGPGSLGPLLHTAYLYLEGGHIGKALEAFERIVEMRPSDPEVYSAIGRVLFGLNYRGEAEVFFEKAKGL